MTTTDNLRKLTGAAARARTATIERDQFIRDAHAAGWSLRAIGDAAGLSHTAVAKIVKRASG